MAYFSNGAEGYDYMERYCMRCVNWRSDSPDEPELAGCPIIDLHLLHNYEAANNDDSYLNTLIPRMEDGRNGQCSMFVDKQQDDDGPVVTSASLERWKAAVADWARA